MGIYARQPRRLVAQVVADAGVLFWVVLCWLVSGWAERLALEVAVPARRTAETAQTVSAQFRSAAEQAGDVPGVGGQLRQPFDASASSVDQLVAAAAEQVRSIERLATLLGWLVFLIPVVVVVSLWLPRRIGFLLRARAAQRFVDSRAALDLFALRTLVHQPLPVLSRIAADPAGAWRAGDATVMAILADVELRRAGLEPRSVAARGRDSAGAPD